MQVERRAATVWLTGHLGDSVSWSLGGCLAKTGLMAGVDDVVSVGVAARTGVSASARSLSHSAQLVVAFFGNEMKITSFAKIFCFYCSSSRFRSFR